MNHISNYPTAASSRELEENSDFVADTITSLSQLAKLGKPATVEELEQRLDDYFSFCAEHGSRIGIESISLCLGVDRTTFWRWCNGDHGKGERWTEICAQAKQTIIAFTEQAMISGKISPPVGIFCMKNVANWKDTVSFEDATPTETTHKNVLDAGELPTLTADKEI